MLYNKTKQTKVIKEGEIMEEYLNKGKEILKILINNGFEAYFIGEAVRNTILNTPITEIEINTSATPDAVKGIFDFTKAESFTEGSVKVMYHGFMFLISTFRLEDYKDKRTPVKIHYSKNLLDDLSSHDFTLHAIAMSHSGKLTDAYNGFEDIKKRRIKMIGKPNVRMGEDPVRCLRALRLVSELNFKLLPNVKSAIASKSKGLKNAQPEAIGPELKKLVQGNHYKKTVDMLVSLKVAKNLPVFYKTFKLQDKKFIPMTFEEFLLVTFVMRSEIVEPYLEFVEDKVKFERIFQLALANPKSEYSNLDLFSNGEEICIAANHINVILRKAHKKAKKITTDYRDLAIKQVCDLTFKGEDILKLTFNKQGEHIQALVDEIIFKVLNHELVNDYDVIKVFVINRLQDMSVPMEQEKIDYNYREPVVEKDEEGIEITVEEQNELSESLQYQSLVDAKNEDEIAESLRRQGQVIKDYTEHRIDMLERRLNEQERIIREKDLKFAQLERESRQRRIESDVDTLVQKNLELIKDSDYLNNPKKDKLELSRQLHQVYMNFVSDAEDKYRNEVKNEED